MPVRSYRSQRPTTRWTGQEADRLPRAILKGATEQMKADHLLIAGCYGVQAATDNAEALLHSQGPAEGYSGL